MDHKIVKSVELRDTQWHAQSVSVNICGTVCTNVTQHCYMVYCFVPTVINSSFGSIFALIPGFNVTKTLTIYVPISFHVLIEENALNLVMLGDLHMHFYSFVVENMKLMHC